MSVNQVSKRIEKCCTEIISNLKLNQKQGGGNFYLTHTEAVIQHAKKHNLKPNNIVRIITGKNL